MKEYSINLSEDTRNDVIRALARKLNVVEEDIEEAERIIEMNKNTIAEKAAYVVSLKRRQAELETLMKELHREGSE